MRALHIVALSGLLFTHAAVMAQDADQPKAAPTFGVGTEVSDYPKVDWVKGEPITQFDKDKIYIVELWATWCGPCKAAIPHLNELSKKFDGKVTIIGQGVFEGDKEAVEKFVKEKGDDMSYRVAFGGDDGSDIDKKWLKPANIRGIPQSIVIQHNKVVWMTHPIDLSDAALQMLVDGKFTIEAAKAASPQRKFRDLSKLIDDGKYDEATAKIKDIRQTDPKNSQLHYYQLSLFQKQGKDAEALAYAKSLYEKDPKEGKSYYYDALDKVKDYKLLLQLTAADLKAKPGDISTIFTRYKALVAQNDDKGSADLIRTAMKTVDDKSLSALALIERYVTDVKPGPETAAEILKAGQQTLAKEPDNFGIALAVATGLWNKDKTAAKKVISQCGAAMKAKPKSAKYSGVAEKVVASLDKGAFPTDEQIDTWYQELSK